MKIMDRLHQFGVAIDQTINTFPLWGGMADETISARFYRHNHEKWGKVAEYITDLIFFWQKKNGKRAHCELAFDAEIRRKHLPKDYREK